MFVDTSVFIAIIANEPEAPALAMALQRQPGFTSPLVVLETVMRASSLLGLPVGATQALVDELLSESGVSVMSITADMGAAAVDAFERFGKGRGHAAQLNLADCMVYACARRSNMPLLFKGDDFSKTDIQSAL
jgi:ribonuclease VapC